MSRKKHFLLILFFLSIYLNHFCQSTYWQQEVNYNIEVSLDDNSHSLDGNAQIEYINRSPDTLYFIWFHLWPNAYKNDKTAFSDQMLENGSTSFYFSSKDDKGYINRLDFKVNNITARTEDHPQHIDIIKLILPQPLAPGNKIAITTPFHVKLPQIVSRSGHDGQSYAVTQWYPKPAVYDREGWHPMPYLDQGEFYSEFGRFDVRITVPENYVVAATGDLQNASEKSWLINERNESAWGKAYRAQHPMNRYDTTFNYSASGESSQDKPISLKKTTDTISNITPASAKSIKTLSYTIDKAHDFAWFADKRFTVEHDTLQLQSGRIIDLYSYYTPRLSPHWKNSTRYLKNAILHYSNLVGEYPYNQVSAVQGPEPMNGGMEYPTITVISPSLEGSTLDKVLAHEVGHNWFYGVLGSNERKYPWLDEGINSYYESEYKKGTAESANLADIAFKTKAVTYTDQPINTPADKFSYINYALVAYHKTAKWIQYLSEKMGKEVFQRGMKNYYGTWKFRHPGPNDFRNAMETAAGRSLGDEFAYLDKHGLLPGNIKDGTTFAFAFDVKKLKHYFVQPTRSLVTIGPALGGNSYDKLLAGIFITNLSFPPSSFQFFVAPMYSTGSKSYAGIGQVKYSHYSYGFFRKLQLGVTASRFSMDEFTGPDNHKSVLHFRKIVPALKLVLREKNPRSHKYRYLQFRSFLVNEDQLQFYRDTVINLPDTIVTTRHRTINENRTLHQLKLVVENNRALYPYRGELKVEQGKHFIRAAFTGNYFFNYVKSGGLSVRLFAGKFFYTSSKTFSRQFETERYHLNMTGPNGYEDYTYSDYFIGRNKFEGLASQQIMIRDGGFKVRTDLLSSKVGKTDDWLVAANFSTTIPEAINPLNLLPVKIPLKLFFDIGTYGDTWKPDAETDRFLFDAGLHVPLLKETINIYIPLVYSNVYRDYIQSVLLKKERFWKKISFSIDISNFSTRKIDRNLDF